ncbi:MAG TPA: hypothetical protein VMR33_12030, partial [Candidatus Baltobacteraceae bacterium]|nr:hypothetical protein [Candidatus Baltobacteraceae bacterium]
EMLTGEVPMGRFEPPSKRVQVDVRLDEVVLRALEREPARRYQQASEVKSNVETITSTPPTAPAAAPVAPAPAQEFPARFPMSDFISLGGFLLALWFAVVTADYMHSLGMVVFTAILVTGAFEFSARLQIQKSREKGLWPQLGELPTVEHVKRLAQAGERKLAIKLYRQIHGGSSADAKAAIENLVSDSLRTTAPAPIQTAPARFPYSDIFAVSLYLVALSTTYLAGQAVPSVGALLWLAIILVGARQLTSRSQIQKSREKGLWPQVGEVGTLEHVKRMAQADEKVLAIKLYRQIHGASLADAKAAVEKLASQAKVKAESPTSTPPTAPAAAPESVQARRLPGFVAYFLKPSRAWAFVCVVGVFTGFAPDWAYTTRYWGVWASDDATAPAQVLKVAADSPAEQSGFRVGDVVKEPATFASFSQKWDRVKQGENEKFTVQRGGKDVTIKASAGENQIAVVWYANLWYPVAGALFIFVGIIVFATGPVVPPPLWRSILVAIAGLGIAVGFAVAVAGDSVFPRFPVYERWIFVPTRNQWCGLQGLFGMAAAVAVTILGAAEIRQRVRKPPPQPGSAR